MTSCIAHLLQVNILYISALSTCILLRGQRDEGIIHEDAATKNIFFTNVLQCFANVLPMVCKPLQTCSLACCPLILLIPPQSTTIRSIKQRRGHTLSLQFFCWAWTPHCVILTDKELSCDYIAFNAYFHISDLLSPKDYTSDPSILALLRITDSAGPNRSARTKPASSMAKPGKNSKTF